MNFRHLIIKTAGLCTHRRGSKCNLDKVAGGFILTAIKMQGLVGLKLVSWGRIQPLFLSVVGMQYG